MITSDQTVDTSVYKELTKKLLKVFQKRLKTLVLFGSQARGEASAGSDHDIFMVIEGVSERPMGRMKEIRSAIMDMPFWVNIIVKTPEELDQNLTPLLFDVCVDGICLYGESYFAPYRQKALKALDQSGLKRKRTSGELYWQFDTLSGREWELTWEGFREF